jgi:hypothetical protein
MEVTAMAAYKLQMIFRGATGTSSTSAGKRGASWSEEVVWDNIDATTRASFTRLCRARAPLLGTGWSIVGQRFQQIDPQGRAQTVAANFPGGQVLTLSATGQPTDAIKFSVRGTGVNNVSRRKLACIPDGQISDGEFNPEPTYLISLRNYLAELNGWKFRGADLTVPKQQVKTISALGIVETNTDLAVVTGDRVRLYGVHLEDGTFHSGTYIVASATSVRIFTLRNWTRGVAEQGQARKYVPIYPIIGGATTATFEACIRKVGRPSGGFRGRASKRRS